MDFTKNQHVQQKEFPKSQTQNTKFTTDFFPKTSNKIVCSKKRVVIFRQKFCLHQQTMFKDVSTDVLQEILKFAGVVGLLQTYFACKTFYNIIAKLNCEFLIRMIAMQPIPDPWCQYQKHYLLDVQPRLKIGFEQAFKLPPFMSCWTSKHWNMIFVDQYFKQTIYPKFIKKLESQFCVQRYKPHVVNNTIV